MARTGLGRRRPPPPLSPIPQNLATGESSKAYTIAFIYPVLVYRGAMDGARAIESLSSKSAAVVETFFIYLGGIFKVLTKQ